MMPPCAPTSVSKMSAQGIFTLCDKLYGLKFTERRDIPVYNPEVQVFEVREADNG